jgi:hypothetical protein
MNMNMLPTRTEIFNNFINDTIINRQLNYKGEKH